MNRLLRSKDGPSKSMKSSQINAILPDFGPIDIGDYSDFLVRSRKYFFDKWNFHLKVKKVKSAESPLSTESGFPSLSYYNKLKLIGSGSFGKVFLVQHTETNKLSAMKAISKETILRYKQLEHTRTEKLVLQCINCPFAIHIEEYFKDNSYIYFLLPFIQGGELYGHLQAVKKFDELSAIFFVAQVILALEYLHFVDIIYRDLKPENILIDHTGYLKIADFGFCKHLSKGRTYTLCGTPEYLAPEVILSKGYGKAVDWWGVGILAYELSAGFTPFKDKKAIKVYEKVLKGSYKMPSYFSEDLKDLVRNILQADISKRYGNLKNGVNDLKDHKWFRPLNWQSVVNRKLKSPYIPDCNEPDDTRYFRDLEYESLQISSTEKYIEEFQDF